MSLSICINPYGKENQRDLEKGLGRIWVRFGKEYFPEENWDDFIIMVLTEWTGSFLEHLDEHSKIFVIPFIDGPFGVKIESNESGEYFASFGDLDELEINLEKEFGFKIPFQRKSLINQILAANRALFDHYEKLNVYPNGLENLRKWHLRLVAKEPLF